MPERGPFPVCVGTLYRTFKLVARIWLVCVEIVAVDRQVFVLNLIELQMGRSKLEQRVRELPIERIPGNAANQGSDFVSLHAPNFFRNGCSSIRCLHGFQALSLLVVRHNENAPRSRAEL